MDPITDIPPAMATHLTDYTADPSPPMTTNHAHPPYAEMIFAAISALKDKDGSSRQAISKYIEKEFTNLPPTHAVLLTQNLKQLKNQGQLIMVKHSYMLPSRSGQFQPQTSSGYHPSLDFSGSVNVSDANDATVGVNLENSPSGLSKRKPGRPPKLKPVPGPGVQSYNADVSSYEPHHQYDEGAGQDLQANYGSSSDFQGNSGGGSEPLFVSLGLGDDGGAAASPPPAGNTGAVAKRGRGRPPKAASGGGGQPPGSGGHVVDSGGGSGDGGGSGGGGSGGGGGGGETQGDETGPERPVRKAKMMSVMMGGNGVRVKRGRGRPRRIGIGAVTVPLSGNVLRPRGRPKRVGRPNVAAVNGGVSQSVSGSRRRGRPSLASLTRKSVGRPRKDEPGTAVLVTDPKQLVVYQELKSKYELLQSKVKQVASMVKPSIDPDYGSTALGALQELEDLAGEVNAPLSNGQTQSIPGTSSVI